MNVIYLILFVWTLPNYEERETSEKFKMKYYMSLSGIEPAITRFPTWHLRPLSHPQSDNNLRLKLMNSRRDNTCIILIMVRCEFETDFGLLHPYGYSVFCHFWSITFQLFWLRITDGD